MGTIVDSGPPWTGRHGYAMEEPRMTEHEAGDRLAKILLPYCRREIEASDGPRPRDRMVVH